MSVAENRGLPPPESIPLPESRRLDLRTEFATVASGVVLTGRTIRNLTAHPVILYIPGGPLRIDPSGTVARCLARPATPHPLPTLILLYDNLPIPVIADTTTTQITGLPPADYAVLLIVSRLVDLAAPHRRDLVFPHTPVRDPTGHTIGCRALAHPPHP